MCIRDRSYLAERGADKIVNRLRQLDGFADAPAQLLPPGSLRDALKPPKGSRGGDKRTSKACVLAMGRHCGGRSVVCNFLRAVRVLSPCPQRGQKNSLVG